MHGGINYGTNWGDIGGAVGYSEDLDEDSLLDYLAQVLAEDAASIQTCRAETPKRTRNSEPKRSTSKERERERVTWELYTLLTMGTCGLSLSSLSGMTGAAMPVVRSAVDLMEARGLAVLARKSRMLFRTDPTRRNDNAAT